MTPHGPVPLTCTTTSSLFQAKWFVLGCMIMMLPGGKGIGFWVSSLAPMPMLKVPKSTVRSEFDYATRTFADDCFIRHQDGAERLVTPGLRQALPRGSRVVPASLGLDKRYHRLLCASSKRHREDTARNAADERSPVHHLMTLGDHATE